jgi:hypothetical protein
MYHDNNNRIQVLDTWQIDFANFINKVKAISLDDWAKIDGNMALKLLSEDEKELLLENGLNFELPQGIGDAYDLRSKVQDMIQGGKWKS